MTRFKPARCGRCNAETTTATLRRHEATCLHPRTLERLYEIGDVEVREDGCHIWHGAFTKKTGYGTHKDGLVHRLSLLLTVGDPPTSKHESCHSCDVRLCINPAHLRWGTRSENMRDAVERGRARGFVTMTQEDRIASLALAREAQRGVPRSEAWKASVRATWARKRSVQDEDTMV